MSAMREERSPSQEAEKILQERRSQDLDILKTLHASAIDRWKDRRDNEWKLNSAIWTAIALADGALFLHGAPSDQVSLGLLALIAFVILLVHFLYLFFVTERAISEVELQLDTELAMRRMIGDEQTRNRIETTSLAGGFDRWKLKGAFWNGIWRHYGILLPITVTLCLLFLGVSLTRESGPPLFDKSKTTETSISNSVQHK
jgi:hypothetical protein